MIIWLTDTGRDISRMLSLAGILLFGCWVGSTTGAVYPNPYGNTITQHYQGQLETMTQASPGNRCYSVVSVQLDYFYAESVCKSISFQLPHFNGLQNVQEELSFLSQSQRGMLFWLGYKKAASPDPWGQPSTSYRYPSDYTPLEHYQNLPWEYGEPRQSNNCVMGGYGSLKTGSCRHRVNVVCLGSSAICPLLDYQSMTRMYTTQFSSGGTQYKQHIKPGESIVVACANGWQTQGGPQTMACGCNGWLAERFPTCIRTTVERQTQAPYTYPIQGPYPCQYPFCQHNNMAGNAMMAGAQPTAVPSGPVTLASAQGREMASNAIISEDAQGYSNGLDQSSERSLPISSNSAAFQARADDRD